MDSSSNQSYFKIITDADFGLTPKSLENAVTRSGARGIILDDQGKVAVLHMTNIDVYKLIGGGVEKGEEPAEAFEREALEESGCQVKIDRELGVIREEKSQDAFVQNSFVYVAHVTKNTSEFHYTETERSRGSELVWLTPEDALAKIEHSLAHPHTSGDDLYQLRFVLKRDIEILKRYLNS